MRIDIEASSYRSQWTDENIGELILWVHIITKSGIHGAVPYTAWTERSHPNPPWLRARTFPTR